MPYQNSPGTFAAVTIPKKRTLFHDQWRGSIHRFAWSDGKTCPDDADVQRRWQRRDGWPFGQQQQKQRFEVRQKWMIQLLQDHLGRFEMGIN
jgi:hypothetical protein